jgi:hypothetical protein
VAEHKRNRYPLSAWGMVRRCQARSGQLGAAPIHEPAAGRGYLAVVMRAHWKAGLALVPQAALAPETG